MAALRRPKVSRWSLTVRRSPSGRDLNHQMSDLYIPEGFLRASLAQDGTPRATEIQRSHTMSERATLDTTCPNNHNLTLTVTREKLEGALKSDTFILHCNT